MTTLTLRNTKGSALTFTELDENFSNLDSDKYQAGDSAYFAAVNVVGTVTAGAFVGDGSGLSGVTSYVRADFDSDFNEKTTTDLTEGTNLYYTTARFDSDLSSRSTSNLTEGVNLYFTSSRARSSITVTDAGGDGSLTYNSATGTITYTGPSASEVRAHFSAGNGIKINSGVISTDSSASVVFNNITSIGNLIIGGNLQVTGTTTTVNSQSLEIQDNMIYINAADSEAAPIASIDIGIAANYNDDGSYAHTGFFRDATDNYWKVFDGYTPEPDASVEIDTAHVSYNDANLQAKIFKSTATSGTSPLIIASNTVVTNLNADLLDGQQGSYYLNQNNHTNIPSRWQNTFMMMGA